MLLDSSLMASATMTSSSVILTRTKVPGRGSKQAIKPSTKSSLKSSSSCGIEISEAGSTTRFQGKMLPTIRRRSRYP